MFCKDSACCQVQEYRSFVSDFSCLIHQLYETNKSLSYYRISSKVISYTRFFFSQMIKLFSACFFYNYFLLLATDYVFLHVFHDSPQKERLFHLLQFKL